MPKSQWNRLENGFLLHKTSNKIIIPEIEFQNVIKKFDESNDQHLNYSQTIVKITVKSQFTWSSKNFEMDFNDIKAQELLKMFNQWINVWQKIETKDL
jgi:hypothetical protein